MKVRWDKKKGRMVRVKKEKVLDGLVGEEEPQEVARGVYREYITSDYFIDTEFDVKVLERELPIPRGERDISVDTYLNFLRNYINRIQNGRRPDKSYFVSAPDGFGKKLFAYQVIKESLRHGLQPSPLLDSHRLYQQLENKEYDAFYQNFDGKDVVLITLGGAPSNTGLIVIKTALEYCERNGIPLITISRFSPESYYRIDVITSTYIGVRAARRGDLGVMELAGFNISQMSMLRDEVRKRLDLEREDLTEMKRN